MIVDLKDNSYSTDNINSSITPQNVYTFTWNAYLKSFLFANRAGMYKYTPSSGWTSFNGPQELSAREGNCMVSSGSGSKVVLFGGGIKDQNSTIGDHLHLGCPDTHMEERTLNISGGCTSVLCMCHFKRLLHCMGRTSTRRPSSHCSETNNPFIRPQD